MIHYTQHLTIVYVLSLNGTLKNNMNILPTFWGFFLGDYVTRLRGRNFFQTTALR